MKRYRNLHGSSGVEAYSVLPHAIRVKFHGSDRIYEYSDKSAGADNVRRMKRLAEAGRGLSTFIATHVGDRYER